MRNLLTCSIGLLFYALASAQNPNPEINTMAAMILPKVIEWRRDFHQHPELSNREFKTAEKIAEYLKNLGLEVTENVAKTGVVALLRGGAGKTVALRADMDALPVTERTNLPFKSTVTTTYLGADVGVSHACGHDTHIAILMGVAEILTKHNEQLEGTVKFIFQPAEEGAPPGEKGGAELMIKEGVLQNPNVDAIFGLHISSNTPINTIVYKPGGTMAASQRFEIEVTGKQTHGSTPWAGTDPIVIAAQIINGLQTIISRESPLTQEAAVITVGKINSGVRNNIIPEKATLIGTIRTLDYGMQRTINRRMREMVPAIAKSFGGEATITIAKGLPITHNDIALTEKMLPTLQKIAGPKNVILGKAITGAEDFSFFQQKVPGFYFFLGGKPKNAKKSAPHHTPDFYIDENGMLLGLKIMTQLAIDYLQQ